MTEHRTSTWCRRVSPRPGRAARGEQARVDGLRERLDRLCRTPLAPAAAEERLHRLIELAHAEAAAIVARARATAKHIHTSSYEVLVDAEVAPEAARLLAQREGASAAPSTS